MSSDAQDTLTYAEYLDAYARNNSGNVSAGMAAESSSAVKSLAARALAVADVRASREPRTKAQVVRVVATMVSTEGIGGELQQAPARARQSTAP